MKRRFRIEREDRETAILLAPIPVESRSTLIVQPTPVAAPAVIENRPLILPIDDEFGARVQKRRKSLSALDSFVNSARAASRTPLPVQVRPARAPDTLLPTHNPWAVEPKGVKRSRTLAKVTE